VTRSFLGVFYFHKIQVYHIVFVSACLGLFSSPFCFLMASGILLLMATVVLHRQEDWFGYIEVHSMYCS